ncbi:GNAT family N-acetyltransferase [Streptomyces sp. AM 4-1-1]|uniref:GNAT family N-acetyltransferase n=1 Tax=Streptomyces sp. AM 4-1-1 TaxID=3028710 RepID=UPI0023B94918|nr:GNAT family N-acetyltransferase [Streptomyces sp. AM 4-1-1]WEH33237.1 GNAT family N-acetyltransferase [Streptomyces sp. AM 4-1-1]
MTENGQRLVIRRLETADLAAVREIYNHAVRRSTSTLDTEEKTTAQMRQWLDHHDERYPAVAAESDGVVVGYGSLSQFASRGGYRASAEISVYVGPGFQGRGVGTRLCHWLTRHAEETGFTGVLAVITAGNTRSTRLFRDAGYTYSGVLNDIGYKHGSLVDLELYQRGFPANRARYAGPETPVTGGPTGTESVAGSGPVVGSGPVAGSGSMTGPVAGSGSVTGPVAGSGSMTGPVAGSGPVAGTRSVIATGPGPVAGNAGTGSVAGPVTGTGPGPGARSYAGTGAGAVSPYTRAVHAQAHAVTELLDGDRPPALDASRPIVLAAAGLSLHSCRTAAAWARLLSGGRVRPAVLPSHALTADEPLHPDDQVVLVGPEASRGPLARLATAAYVVDGGPGGRSMPRAVARVGELAVLARLIARTLGEDAAGPLMSGLRGVPDALSRAADLPLSPAAEEALACGRRAPLLIASGALDAPAAAEAAAAVKSAAQRWAEAVCLDAIDDTGLDMGLDAVGDAAGGGEGGPATACLVRPPGHDGARADRLAGRLRALGVRVVISSDDEESDMPFPEVPSLVRSFVITTPFQRPPSTGTVTR